MSHKTLYASSAIAAFMIASAGSASAAVILFEDFEDTAVTYTSNVPDDLSDGASRDYYGIVTPGSVPSDVSYTNLQGNGYYGAQDTDGATNPVDDITLDWTGINIASFTNLNLSFFVAEDEASNGAEDWDTFSYVSLMFQIDGGGYMDLFAIASELGTDGNETNEKARVDTDFDGTGDGAEITDVFTSFNFGLASGGLLDLRLTITDLNAADEDIAFDNLLLTGDQPIVSAVPLPAGVLLLGSALAGLGFARRKS